MLIEGRNGREELLRSFAQWSLESLSVLSKRSGASSGVEQKTAPLRWLIAIVSIYVNMSGQRKKR
jgi:hypothetical protein